MAKIIWTAGALQDLDEIANYIVRENAGAANKLVTKIFERVDLLENFPEFGRFAPELSGHIHRQLVIPPCKVIYKIVEEVAFIELVIRGERLLKEELLQRNF